MLDEIDGIRDSGNAKQRRAFGVQRLAYHEAGHAISACLVRRTFSCVSLVKEGESLGRCLFDVLPDPTQLASSRHREQARRLLESEIIIAYGGLIAEGLYAGRYDWRGASADLQRAEQLVAAVVDSEEEAIAYLRWLFLRTRRLLTVPRHWQAVDTLARALLTHREIEYRRVLRIIKDTPFT